MPGSVYWWCRPIGTESTRKSRNDTRAIGSLKSLPPASVGTMVYQEMYAGRSQKYTIGWPVNQNRVRASSGSVPGARPKAHGSSSTSISTAMPKVAITHIVIVTMDINAARGIFAPGLSRRQARRVSTWFARRKYVPTTTIVRPR